MAKEIRNTEDMCSVCLGGDFKTCPCPWDKPFDRWPSALLAKVAGLVAGGPRPGS